MSQPEYTSFRTFLAGVLAGAPIMPVVVGWRYLGPPDEELELGSGSRHILHENHLRHSGRGSGIETRLGNVLARVLEGAEQHV